MTKEEKIQAILNLALVVVSNSRQITPATQERARNVLGELKVTHEDSSYREIDEKEWLRSAKIACHNWREL